jgi:hypothetical protein
VFRGGDVIGIMIGRIERLEKLLELQVLNLKFHG